MALVGEDEDRGKTLDLSKHRGMLRLQLIANEVAHTLSVWQPMLVAVEGYAYVRNVGSFVTLVEAGTVIRLELRKANLAWVEVPPTVLKKWTAGKGNATKDLMAIAVKQRWGFESPSDDVVDAYALAQMASLGWDAVLQVKGVSVGWASA